MKSLLKLLPDDVANYAREIRAAVRPQKPLFYQAPRAGRGKRALLHYKTDSLVSAKLASEYAHTNFWEVLEIIRLLQFYDFEVDVVDRSHHSFVPEGDVYDLVVSNASGNSGKNFLKFAPLLPKAKKVFYALGPNPDIANSLVLERYKRHQDMSPMRVMDETNINECMKYTDYIFCLDHNGFSTSSYDQFSKPIYNILPSISPLSKLSYSHLATRSKKNFLCFVGDGFIAKGVDVLVEAMEKLPRDYNLYIAGPDTEQAFFDKYDQKILALGNVHYEGFVKIGGGRHRMLLEKCAYVVLPAAAEGLATSLATSMACGLVPIATYESGVNINSCGFYCSSDAASITDSLCEIIKKCAELTQSQYETRVFETIARSSDFSQAAFTFTWTKALASILGDIK